MKKQSLFFIKSRIAYLLIIFSAILQSCEKNPAETPDGLINPGVYDVSVKVDTLTRWFKVIVPPDYDHSNKHPLLMAFHGGNLSMGFMLNNRQDIIQRCEEENWVLVFPNGANFDDNRGAATWNAIHCCDPAMRFNVDDIGFTSKIVDTLKTELNIDTKRIYAIGGSNGGMLVHKIATELPDIFAAVAENQGVAGGRPDTLSDIIVVEPIQKIPFIFIHGMSDLEVKFQGGWSLSWPRYDIPFAESVSIWANNNGCGTTPDTTIVDGLNGKVWIVDFNNCSENFDIRAIAIENKGHGWPGIAESGYDGTNASIDFLRKYSK